MYIPTVNSAAQAAGIAAQATAKEPSSEAAVASATAAIVDAAVEHSSSTSADRDAQGQGDGLADDRRGPPQDELELGAEAEVKMLQSPHAAPVLPDEPPSQLDIVG